MNSDQRKYLIAQVDDTYDHQRKLLEKQKSKEPSLNNYLVAACLDNTLQLQSTEVIREKIRKSVLAFGPDDALIKNTKKTWTSNDDVYGIRLDPEDIFIYPEAYLKALAEYEEKIRDIDDKLELLRSQYKTVSLKINIGSNQTLDKLVAEVDNMADLSLMNDSLTLQLSAPEVKQIENKKKRK